MTTTSGKRRAVAANSVTIASNSALDKALREVCRLMSSMGAGSSNVDATRFDELVNGIEKFEDDTYPMDEPSQATMLKHLMEAKDQNPKALAKAIGTSVAAITEILNGKRNISHPEAKKLAKHFHVEPSVFECDPVGWFAAVFNTGPYRIVNIVGNTGQIGGPASITSITGFFQQQQTFSEARLA